MAEDIKRRDPWEDAVSVAAVRGWLEPMSGVRPGGSNTLGDAVGGLRELARQLPWVLVPAAACAPDLAFALALDKQDVEERLLAIVCRAYARAADYAALYRRLKSDRAQAKKDIDRLRDCIFSQPGEMDALLRRVEAHRIGDGENDEDRRARRLRVDAAHLLAVDLLEWANALAHDSFEREQGPTLVLLMRLCHAFVLSTAVEDERDIPFHDTHDKKNNWVDFVKISTKILGFDISIDTSLRMLGSKGSYSTKYPALTYHVTAMRNLRDLLVSSRASLRNEPIPYAQLPVSGIEGQIGLSPAPGAWP